jgi:outer membrane receptor protein involved in Fe transport
MRRVAWLVSLFLAGALYAAESIPLATVLEELQRRGVPIVYSTSLVRPEMLVTQKPENNSSEAIRRVLAPHGLTLREGPAGQLIVVRAPEKPPAPPPPQPDPSPLPVYLDEVIVTPSHYRVVREEPEPSHTLGRETLDRMPNPGDDLFAAMKRLPGTSSPDLSAKFNVRGGEPDELLVLLDGVELYEPFHLKDFLSLFSIVDSSAVERVDLLTGGFPAQYGGRMAGVMDISTRESATAPAHSISFGTLDAAMLSTGSLNDGKTKWVASMRGWYPDSVLRAAGQVSEELLTDYYDVLAKLTHQLSESSSLTVGALTAYDDLAFGSSDADEVERVEARYDSQQIWANLNTAWSDSLSSRTVLTGGDVRRKRSGGIFDDLEGTLQVLDRRTFQFFSIRQDWLFEPNDRHLLKWGIDAKRQRAEYDYSRRNFEEDPIAVHFDPEGQAFGAYVTDRFRIGQSVVAELGLRWDRSFQNDEHLLSPRINVMYALAPRTVVRGAWGRYHQPQQLNELQVEDGVDRLYPAQYADHALLSLEHRFAGGLAFRVEAYDKKMHRLRPRFENLFSPIELFAEGQPDRVRIEPQSGRSTGVETRLENDLGQRFNWWLSYTQARAIDRIDGRDVPRSWDQRHASTFGIAARLPWGFSGSLAGNYHSGWPTTAMVAQTTFDDDGQMEIELVPGPRNGERLPSHFRLDARLTKDFPTSLGQFTIVAEVLNATNRANVCCVDDFAYRIDADGAVDVVPEYSAWPGPIPSLAVRWRP